MDNAMAPEGWTAVPNDLLDNMGDLGNAELRVLLAIIRKTAGYQKECDRVSVSQIATMTGLTSRNAQAAITKLLESGHIGREQAGKQTYSYFVKPYPYGTRLDSIPTGHGEDAISPRDTEPYPLGIRNVVKPYPVGTTQKKELKKEERDSSPASDDAVTPPADAPKAKAKTLPNRNPKVKAAAPAAPSDHKRLMQEYADILGYALPNGGKEAAGAALLLKAGYTVEQVVSVYCEMKADKFWASKHLSLHNVHQQIGAILNQQQARQRAAIERTNGLNGHHTAEVDEGQYASREEWQALRGGGGK